MYCNLFYKNMELHIGHILAIKISSVVLVKVAPLFEQQLRAKSSVSNSALFSDNVELFACSITNILRTKFYIYTTFFPC